MSCVKLYLCMVLERIEFMKTLYLFVLSLFIVAMVKGQEAPALSKDVFADSALNQPVFALDGKQTTIRKVLNENLGKTVVLYVWATWCPDCLNGFPELYALQKANPDVHFLFLSLDREEKRWSEGVIKYKLEGEHYWFKTGWKNAFTNYIDLNWIPRYMVIDPMGNIAGYYAITADDPAIQQAIDQVKRP